jgi:putative endonuclease
MEWLSQIWITRLEHGLTRLDRLARRRGRAPARPDHLITGMQGEDAAYFYLRRKGYIVVARRWSPGHQPGDIDIIAWQGTLLCMIEVKTRTAHDLTPAEAAVDFDKRRTLRRLARQYVRQLPQPTAPQVRFDVISVYLVPGQEKEFVHFESAFGWSERRDGEWR